MPDRSRSSQGQRPQQGQPETHPDPHAAPRRPAEVGGSEPQGRGDVPGAARWGQAETGPTRIGWMAHGQESARQTMGHRSHRAQGTIARHPAALIAIGFGLGLGVGAWLGLSLTRRESWSRMGRLRESMSELPERVFHWAGHRPEVVSHSRYALPERVRPYLPYR